MSKHPQTSATGVSVGLAKRAIASALAWAVGVMLYRQLGASLPPLQLNFTKNLMVLAMLLPAIPMLHGFEVPTFSTLQLAAAIGSGMLGIGIADTLYFRALNELGAGRMGVLGNFYSPFVIVLSFLFLDERLLPLQLAGFALVSVAFGCSVAGSGADALSAHAACFGLARLAILLWHFARRGQAVLKRTLAGYGMAHGGRLAGMA